MSLKHIHPFPARMAPEIVLDACRTLPPHSSVLDPMTGSGTVIRVAAEAGFNAVGCDTDPLAVLIASVWTSGINPALIESAAEDLVYEALALQPNEIEMPWGEDQETDEFVSYWFAVTQRDQLVRLSVCLRRRHDNLANVLRLCLSRLIITKDHGASLARDVSHSRPHKVCTENDFDVMLEYKKSARAVAVCLSNAHIVRPAQVYNADSRNLNQFENETFDVAITSPPYLNAIDYMRAHKMSLVWLGYTISQLRAIRSGNVGAERALDATIIAHPFIDSIADLLWFQRLPSKEQGMVRRYALDILKTITEIARLLRQQGKLIVVIGNSCLRGIYIENSHVVEMAAAISGLQCTEVYVRDLPISRRYLPMPNNIPNDELAKRMRKECVLTFERCN